MFPGYLFAKFASSSARHVVSLPFVSNTLRHLDKGSVPESVINEIKSAVQENEIIMVAQNYAPGQDVEIAAGPLMGQTGKLVRVLPGAERVRILLEFMGGTQEMEISILSLLSGQDPRIAALPASG